MGTMDMILGRAYGAVAAPSPFGATVAPGLGGLTPGMAPGVIAPAPSTDSSGHGGSGLDATSPGYVGVAIVGLLVLALVGFNFSTRAFQA